MHRNETNCQGKGSLPLTLAELKKCPFLCILLSKIVADLSIVPIPAGNSPLMVNCFTAGPAVTSVLPYHIGAALNWGIASKRYLVSITSSQAIRLTGAKPFKSYITKTFYGFQRSEAS